MSEVIVSEFISKNATYIEIKSDERKVIFNFDSIISFLIEEAWESLITKSGYEEGFPYKSYMIELPNSRIYYRCESSYPDGNIKTLKMLDELYDRWKVKIKEQ